MPTKILQSFPAVAGVLLVLILVSVTQGCGIAYLTESEWAFLPKYDEDNLCVSTFSENRISVYQNITRRIPFFPVLYQLAVIEPVSDPYGCHATEHYFRWDLPYQAGMTNLTGAAAKDADLVFASRCRRALFSTFYKQINKGLPDWMAEADKRGYAQFTFQDGGRVWIAVITTCAPPKEGAFRTTERYRLVAGTCTNAVLGAPRIDLVLPGDGRRRGRAEGASFDYSADVDRLGGFLDPGFRYLAFGDRKGCVRVADTRTWGVRTLSPAIAPERWRHLSVETNGEWALVCSPDQHDAGSGMEWEIHRGTLDGRRSSLGIPPVPWKVSGRDLCCEFLSVNQDELLMAVKDCSLTHQLPWTTMFSVLPLHAKFPDDYRVYRYDFRDTCWTNLPITLEGPESVNPLTNHW